MKISVPRAIVALAAAIFSTTAAHAADPNPLRPAAVPLVTVDPYISIWSEADKLTDRATRHWTGHAQPLVSLIRIDGTAYRLMGNDPTEVPPLAQTGLVVSPTKTTYTFTGAGVKVVFSFLTPLLPNDLEVMSRPVTYLTWEVRSTDNQPHAVQLFDSTSGLLTVNEPNQKITWSTEKAGDLTMLKMGTVDQRMLGNPGDDTRIDWGYAYTVAKSAEGTSCIGGNGLLLNSFVATGKLPETDDTNINRGAMDDQPICGFTFDLGQVTAAPVTRQVMLGYDEVQAIKYFGKPMQPYWRRNGAGPAELFQTCEKQYAQIEPKCEAFDAEVIADATKLGGDPYAKIVSLAYRQCWAGCGLCADSNKQPHLLCKENSSDGNLATVDVFFPMDPIWVLFSPGLAKSTMAAVFQYSMSDHWKFPNAPHDIGEYPQVFGRDNGGEGMPVEESANMLILADAVAQMDGNADWVKPWWPKCQQWAQYLEKYGLDPEDQLCTDDFMGHLAHNSNLSVKAIVGLAAYGDMCRMRGDTAEADRYRDLAKADALHWMKAAIDGSGDHYKLSFDKSGTWSQKYNLVWDKILGLNVFPPEVAQKEVAWYKTQLQQYGLPLDSRTKLTKTDWTCWSATLADNQADFETLISPIIGYVNNTTKRLPFADSYVTTDINSDGMRARPVIGGVFIRFLSDKTIWKKYAGRDTIKPANWDPVPPPPVITEVVPTAKIEPVAWLYTTAKPGDDWIKPQFDATGWKSGLSGFGTEGTPGLVFGTKWNTDDIWIRREITVPANINDGAGDLQFLVKHDEDVEIYIDGVAAASEAGFNDEYAPLSMTTPAKALLVPGKKIVIAAHCHQTTGGQGIDIGICRVVEGK